jgi:serine/threonine protein kinase/tetratricopeptide (TPR) repeat protein
VPDGPPTPASGPRAGWEDLFDELVDLHGAERTRRLQELRAENPELAGRLESLLVADQASAGFLDRPTLDLLGAAGDDGAEADAQLPPGTTIGPWRVVRLQARGGMGEVYLAERCDAAFEQQVALKVIKRGMDSRAIVRRFVRERQILARLDHPNLAHLLDGGTMPDGRPYFAMEWVDGIPITDYCDQHDLDLAARLRLVAAVCQAVDSAHRRLVVHRDLKPANILVTPGGTVKLLDFGIAKLLADEVQDGLTLTRLGARVLTPDFAAPEQILGEPVSTATDVYTLGVLLFLLITGSLPHHRDTRDLSSLASGVEHETVERPSALMRGRPKAGTRPPPTAPLAGESRTSGAPGSSGARGARWPPAGARRRARQVAGDLDLIVLTAMHRDPARRYPGAQALADDLENFLAGRPIRARPDEIGYRVRKFVGRHRVPLAAAGAGIAALIAGLALSLWQAHAARLAATRADAAAQRAERVKTFLISIFQQSDPDLSNGANMTARELLENGAAKIDRELSGEPEVQADLLDAVASVELNLDVVEPGLAHARRALALRQAVLPPDDGRIGQARVTLGELQRSHGDLAEATRSYEAALPVLIHAFGIDSVEVATARRELTEALPMPEQSARAVKLLRQALPAFVHHLGETNPESASALLALARALEQDRQYAEAEAAYRRSTALLARAHGPRSISLAAAQSDLAGLLDRMGRPAEARPLFERAIAIEREMLGPHSGRLAEVLFSYGLLLLAAQDYAAADQALSEAMAIFGPDRFDTGHCLRYLGLSAIGQEQYRQAADLLTRAVETYRRTSGDDVQTWRASADLGYVRFLMGRPHEARDQLTAAVAAITRLAGAGSYEICLPLRELGEVQTAAGEAPAAVDTLRRLRALQEKLFGTREHREVAATDLVLAKALLARGIGGDGPEARRLLDEGSGIFARLNPQDLRYGDTLLESGRLALAQGDRARAGKDLATAVALLTARRGAAHRETREANRLLEESGGGAAPVAGPTAADVPDP